MFEPVVDEYEVVVSFAVDFNHSQTLPEIAELLEQAHFSTVRITDLIYLGLGGSFGVVDKDQSLLISQLVQSLKLETVIEKIRE